MSDRAQFMKGRGGVSDTLHGDLVKKHMANNWKLNQTNTGVHNNLAQPGPIGPDNTKVRTMPGRKRGMYSGS